MLLGRRTKHQRCLVLGCDIYVRPVLREHHPSYSCPVAGALRSGAFELLGCCAIRSIMQRVGAIELLHKSHLHAIHADFVRKELWPLHRHGQCSARHTSTGLVSATSGLHRGACRSAGLHAGLYSRNSGAVQLVIGKRLR